MLLGNMGMSPGEAAYERAKAAGEPPIEEITVSTVRIPWWQWALAGGLALFVVNKVFKR